MQDSGIGIEPEALGRVFNAFEQSEIAVSRQFGGLGLGLTISEAIVEMHGGEIEARSEGHGRGATFSVRLPMTMPVRNTEIPIQAAATQQISNPLRILLVEDHVVTAQMIRMVLQEKGHTVETASDIATALELAGSKNSIYLSVTWDCPMGADMILFGNSGHVDMIFLVLR